MYDIKQLPLQLITHATIDDSGLVFIDQTRKTSLTIPLEFICPITGLLMTEPFNAPDGRTYEKEALELWLLDNACSPTTGEFFQADYRLIPNTKLQNDIRTFYRDKLLYINSSSELQSLQSIKHSDKLQLIINEIIRTTFEGVDLDRKNGTKIVIDLASFSALISENELIQQLRELNINNTHMKLIVENNKIILENNSNTEFLTSSVLLEFLNAVVNGDINKMQAMVAKNYITITGEISGKILCSIKGTILDHTGTLYREITGLYLTIILSHYEMFTAMQKLIGEQDTTKQIQSFQGCFFSEKSTRVTHLPLSHAYDDLLEIIHQYAALKNNPENSFARESIQILYTKREEIETSMQRVGELQRELPKHFLYRFFNPNFRTDKVAYPLEKYTKCFKTFCASISLNKLGADYILLRLNEKTIRVSLTVKSPCHHHDRISNMELLEELEIFKATTSSRNDCLKECCIREFAEDQQTFQALFEQSQKCIDDEIKKILENIEQKVGQSWFGSVNTCFWWFLGYGTTEESKVHDNPEGQKQGKDEPAKQKP